MHKKGNVHNSDNYNDKYNIGQLLSQAVFKCTYNRLHTWTACNNALYYQKIGTILTWEQMYTKNVCCNINSIYGSDRPSGYS